MLRLEEKYYGEVRRRLSEKFGYKNQMQVPRVLKVTVNVGVGDARENAKLMETTLEELKAVTGQKPVITKAKQSVANFKLRKNQAVGCFVTLRRARMWAFLDKLFNLALPRVRDFRGVSEKAFDGRGSYNLGVREQLIFPEIKYDKVERIRGMNISIVTTAKNDIECRELLTELGMPFRKVEGGN
ncbi:MAG: 50S ribosomal protein L5 [Candidatus Wallbacteria bacterium]|nr:50S ribosomal protein L5 [Candidatus Wallbacteria bacterium]